MPDGALAPFCRILEVDTQELRMLQKTDLFTAILLEASQAC